MKPLSSFVLSLLIGTLGFLIFASAQAKTPARPAPGAPAVAHAVFARAVHAREPVHPFTTLPNTVHRVYYFTVLKDMTGQTVRHRWTYHGKVMAVIPLHVGGPRWRVWSAKRLLPTQLGTWSAAVVDARGHVLARNSFTYVKAAPAAHPAPATTAATPAPGHK